MEINGYLVSDCEKQELESVGVWVYILKLRNNTYYTGITKHLVTRLIQHNKGLSYSTKRHLPCVLKYIVKFNNYKEARWLEKKIKHRGARNYLCHSYCKIK
jgi:predicted GIY-YIG superfamily endonuclease